VVSCGDNGNTLKVYISEKFVDLEKLKRNFYTTSSCGVCGKSSIDALRVVGPYQGGISRFKIKPELIYTLTGKITERQKTYKQTGGLHASALFDMTGKLISLFEDVGRHNALDKLIGSFFETKSLPLDQFILLLSGRISFELVQKAAMSGVKCIVAIGAPSSLALKLAEEFDITLIGFLKENRFNVYSGMERIEP
jgi:FdhD protein